MRKRNKTKRGIFNARVSSVLLAPHPLSRPFLFDFFFRITRAPSSAGRPQASFFGGKSK